MAEPTLAAMLRQITEGASGEAPDFMFCNIRDWWTLRRGSRWRYPLPEIRRAKRRVFQQRIWKLKHQQRMMERL